MDNTTRIERAAAKWLVRRDAESWSAADQAAFDGWLAASTLHRVIWLRLEAAWRESGRLKALGAGVAPGEVPIRGGWNLSPFLEVQPAVPDPSMIASRPDGAPGGGQTSPARTLPWRELVFAEGTRVRRRPKVRRPMAAAALLLAAVAGGVAGWWHMPVAHGVQATHVGEMRTIELPDGSRATLSSASRVRWTTSRSRRTMELDQGEVFVDVVRDPRRSFAVVADGHRAIAVGTRFSMRRTGGDTRVVVTEGRVRFTSSDDGAPGPVLLQPGMVATAGTSGIRIESLPLDQAESLLSWRDGYLGFRNTPLVDAVAEFNRYNARRLVIGDPAIAAIPIGGNFRWNNVEVVVRLLEQGFELRAEARDGDVVLYAR